MIIISDKPGQLGNLLIVYATVLAYSLEHSVSLANPAFYGYQHYFVFPNKYPAVLNKILFWFTNYFARTLVKLNINSAFIGSKSLHWNESINMDTEGEFNPRNSKFYFIMGWLYRGDKLIEKHSDYIKDFFSPAPLFETKLKAFFNETFEDKNEVIIGIHIRHGDYKTFENGKYYYSITQYEKILDKLTNLFEHQKVHFLICSNAKNIQQQITHKSHKLSFAPNHELLDLYSLAKCNYIVGPPSTYSIWASFYGNTPLYMIHDVEKNILLQDFKVRNLL